MAKLYNRAKMTTVTSGTGAIVVGSAVPPYQTFEASGVQNGEVLPLLIEDGLNWELSTGTYTSSTKTLTRTLIESSTGSLLNLSGAAVVSIALQAHMVGNVTEENTWEAAQHFDVPIDVTDVSGAQSYHGFVFPYECSLSYDKTARTITITPTGSTFDVWVQGVKYTKTGAQVSTAHPNSSGSHFLYYNTSGELTWSTSPWDFKTVSPVAYVFYSTTAADGIALFELHTYKRNPEWHESQHFAIGTFVRTGLDASGYVLNSSASDADITYQISGGIVVDEDIEYTATTLPEGGPYTIVYRTGASEFNWTTTPVIPYLTGATYIQYNQLTGGSYALTELASGQFVNYYLFATTAIEAQKRFFIVPGQAVHATLTSAQTESVSSLALGSFGLPESVAVWKFTYSASAGYNGTTGRVRVVEVNRLTSTRGSLNVNITTTTHNLLTGRDAIDAHPASAITFTPTGALSSTTVSGALAELDSEKQPIDGDLTAIAALAGTTGLLRKTDTNVWSLDTTIYLENGGALGTPSSGTLTNCIGLPLSSVTGFGTGVATALAVNVGSTGAPVVQDGALGTPSSGTLTNCTGLPVSTGVSGLGTGVATALGNTTNAASGLVVLDVNTKLPAVDGSQLTGIAAGATGGSTDKTFWVNDQTVTADYTVATGKNAGTFGPVTINAGVTVTVSADSVWTVV